MMLIFVNWQGMMMVLLLGWLFLPIYIASGVSFLHTLWKKETISCCMHDFGHLFPRDLIELDLISSTGDNDARVSAEAVWW